MALKNPGYREKLRMQIESAAMPRAMRLLPRCELTGRGEALVERHRGLLEYSEGRVLVLLGADMLEIEGDSLKIAEMNRNCLRVKGNIKGIKLIDG